MREAFVVIDRFQASRAFLTGMIMEFDEPTSFGRDSEVYVGIQSGDNPTTINQKIVDTVAARFSVDPQHVTIY